MTDLSDIALAFAKECMGWLPHSTDEWHNGEDDSQNRPVLYNRDTAECFGYGDLNAVMAVARKWCGENDCSLALSTDKGGEWNVEINLSVSEYFEGLSNAASETATEALMLACISASRKLKGTEA